MATSRPTGFTILEMLVVLLIAGMAMALTFQVLGQYQRAYARAGASEAATRELRLGEAWFRESVRGLYPSTDREGAESAASTRLDRARLEPVFEGTADGFTGVTLAPVLAGQGMPTVQRWKIVRDADTARIVLEEGGGDPLPLRFVRVRDMRLHYLDSAGKTHARWPPATGREPQLPAAIALELLGEAPTSVLVTAAIQGPRDRPAFLRYEAEEL